MKSGSCNFCKKNVLKENIIQVRDKDILVCKNCDYNRLIGLLKLIPNALEALASEDNINIWNPILNSIDKLLIRQVNYYTEEDRLELIEGLRLEFFQALFEINSIFIRRFHDGS